MKRILSSAALTAACLAIGPTSVEAQNAAGRGGVGIGVPGLGAGSTVPASPAAASAVEGSVAAELSRDPAAASAAMPSEAPS